VREVNCRYPAYLQVMDAGRAIDVYTETSGSNQQLLQDESGGA
jgi:hypothetical protein